MAFRPFRDAMDPSVAQALPPYDVEDVRGRATVRDAHAADIPLSTYYHWKRGDDGCDLRLLQFIALCRVMKLRLRAIDDKQLAMLTVRRDDPDSASFTRT